jgi:murein DD-endopeptidase MepM/ murein hydrolase activator NlpD
MVNLSIDMTDYTKPNVHNILRLFAALLVVILLFSTIPAKPAIAQVTTYPEYVVVSGDTLSWIALRFDSSLDNLLALNGLTETSMLRPGDRLKIPSLAGMQGVLTTEYVALGSSLTSLSRRSQAQPADLIRANNLTSPSELFIGREIVITHIENAPVMTTMASLKPGQSFLEASVLAGQNTWTLTRMNRLQNPLHGLPMDTYYKPSDVESPSNLAIPGVKEIVVDNLPLFQGDTFLIEVTSDEPVKVRASLAGVEPVFVDMGGGVQMAYGGIHALTDVGVYPLTMEFSNSGGETYRFDQYVMISSGNFATDKLLQVDPASVGTEEEKAENEKFKAVVAPVTPVQQWSGLWYSPAQDADCVISSFGSRRTYNEDPNLYYHTGLDLGYCKGVDVYAPAGGTVVGVFPDQVVRGNAIVIDHGLGVYTIYMHLAAILVSEGEVVEPGQLIGIIGTTGRSTGPHLHFEVDIQGTPVNPLTWLRRAFP